MNFFNFFFFIYNNFVNLKKFKKVINYIFFELRNSHILLSIFALRLFSLDVQCTFDYNVFYHVWNTATGTQRGGVFPLQKILMDKCSIFLIEDSIFLVMADGKGYMYVVFSIALNLLFPTTVNSICRCVPYIVGDFFNSGFNTV